MDVGCRVRVNTRCGRATVATYWSSTLSDHVIYESRLKLANLMIADFDTGVKRIAAQQPEMRRTALKGR